MMAQDGGPLRTALFEKHAAMEAAMGLDGGWEMPMAYGGALDEALRVCNSAGVLDVSHIGRIRIRGDEALDLVERVCTADVVCQEDDTARYTLLCNESGGIIDQCMILRLDDWWLLTTSPACRQKVLEYLQRSGEGMKVKVDDQTPKTSMICVAGPEAERILDGALPVRVAGMAPGAVKVGSLMIARYTAMRTDYLGQWALEVVLPNMFAAKAWRFITDKAGAGKNAVAPVGMAARDVLRIEAWRCRYGHELNETIDPFTAGLADAVDFEHDFLGREALAKLRDRAPARRRVGLALDADRLKTSIPAMGTIVSDDDGRELGTVTSGTFSPSLDRPIAMAYVSADAAEPGARVKLQLASGAAEAEIIALPPAS